MAQLQKAGLPEHDHALPRACSCRVYLHEIDPLGQPVEIELEALLPFLPILASTLQHLPSQSIENAYADRGALPQHVVTVKIRACRVGPERSVQCIDGLPTTWYHAGRP